MIKNKSDMSNNISNQKLKIDKKCYIVLFILVAINLFVFSSVSPIRSIMNMQYNEWLYYLIGKGINAGNVLYVDLIDHKGPYLFFLFAFANLIGSANHIGLYILAVIIYFVIALYSFKISYLILNSIKLLNDKKNLIISFIIGFTIYFVSSSYYMSFGTITAETFILAFVLATYYLFLEFLFSDNKKHSVRNAFIYGIFAGIVFLIKANGILCFAGIAIVLLIKLFKDKKILLMNIAFGMLGIIISFISEIIYCIATDSFYEMIEGAFIINFLYTGTGLPSLNSLSLSFIETIKEFKEYTAICILSVPMFFYLIRNISKDKKLYLKLFYIISLLINIYSVYMSVRPYSNYLNFITFYLIPVLIFFAILLDKIFDIAVESKISKIIPIIILLFINILSYSFTFELSNLNGYNQERLSNQAVKIYATATNKIKRKPKMLVVGYAPYLYEAFGVIPNEKFFATPVVPRKTYSEPYKAILNRINKNYEDLIIVAFDRTMKNDEEFKSLVYSALEKNYNLIGNANGAGIKIEIYNKK